MSRARNLLVSSARALTRRRTRPLMLLCLAGAAALACVPVVLADAEGPDSPAEAAHTAAVRHGILGHGKFDLRRLANMSAAQGAALPAGQELVSHRTATSRTFQTKDGRYITRIYPWAVNYRDAQGQWQSIDDTLVPSSTPGYAYTNKADDYRVDVPATLSGKPIRVSDQGGSVALRLLGATGHATASGTTAAFAKVLPGVDASYAVAPGRLKEALTLANAGAPSTYSYSLDLSPGLTAQQNASGGITISNAAGKAQFDLLAPFAYDAAGARIDAGHGISLQLSRAASGLVVTVAVDPAWLRAADRRYPVTIDPGVDASDSQDCYIESGTSANTSFCGGQTLKIGYDGTNDYRALLQFNVQGAVPANSTIEGANMAIYLQSETNSANPASIGAYQLTRSWTTAATWNKYDGTNSWTTAGGDFQSSPTYSQTPGATTAVWNAWSMSALTQGWYTGSTANYGVILKETTENVNNVYSYASKAQTSFAPYLQVDWEPSGMGIQRWYPMVSQKLTDRSSLAVNAANGNLVVHSTDLATGGTGMPLTVQRTYNNLSPDIGAWGYGWSINSGYDMWLDVYGDAVTLHDSTYTSSRFDKTGTDGSGNTTYKAPSGIDATLLRNASDGSYTLTYNKSGVKLHWSSDADDLQWIQDKNGHQITVNYNSSEPDNPTSLVDTQNRTTTLGWHTGPTNPCINQITDSSTRAETYTFYPDSSFSCGMLETYVDGAAKTTTYSYDGNDNLTTITNPAGDITQIGYDASNRVTSIKRITNNTTMAGDTTTLTYGAGYTVVADPDYSGGTPAPGAAHTMTFYYDAQGRRTKTVNGKGNTETTSWTSDNGIQTDTTPVNQSSGQMVANTFDNNNNMTEQVGPNTSGNGATKGADWKWSYTASGSHPYLPDSSTSPTGNQFSYSYDQSNDLTQIMGNQPQAAQANYDYNHISYATSSPPAKCSNTTDTGPTGTVRCSKDGNGNETYYNYDAAGNLTKISPPAGGSPGAPVGTTEITPDSLSRISTVTDGLNQQTAYHYDGDDRASEIDYADGTKVTYTYDGDGNLTQRFDSASGGGTSTYTYDLKNRLTRRQDPYGTSSYGYDAADNMLSMTDSGGTVSYGYDNANLVCYVYVGSSTNGCGSPPAGATTFAYDADANRTSTTYPGSVVMSQTYDNADRLTEIKAMKGASKLTDFVYSYVNGTTDQDARSSVVDTGNNKTVFTYDHGDRLQEAQTKTSGGSGTVTFDRTYAYDGAGNICWTYSGSATGPSCSTPPSSGVTSYRYGSDNQLCWSVSGTSSNVCGSPPTGATTYSYDANGMETSDSDPTYGGSSSYNTRGQYSTWRGVSPQTFIGPDQTERTVNGVDSYQWNALGLGERNHSGSVYYYTHDPLGKLVNERSGSSTYSYVFDGLGSVVAITDSNGNVVNSYQYDPQGNVIGTPTENVDNRWRFASGLWSPSTGTLQYGQRFYDPGTERWTQPDPMPAQSPYYAPSGGSLPPMQTGSIPAAPNPQTTGGSLPPFTGAALAGPPIPVGHGNPATSYGVLQANRYMYAGDSPQNFVDPTGLNQRMTQALAGIAIACGVTGQEECAVPAGVGAFVSGVFDALGL